MTTPYTAVPIDPTAVMGRRVVAAIIDVVIAIAILTAVFLALAQSVPSGEVAQFANGQAFCDFFNNIAGNAVCVASGDDAFVLEGNDLWLVIGAPFIYSIANLVFLAGATGASIGKHIMGLRVISQSDGSLHGFGAAALRWLLWIVDGIPGGIFFPLVGLITSLASNGHRRVGDMTASTLVVDKSQVGIPPAVIGLTTMAAAVGMPLPAPIAQQPTMPAQPAQAPPTGAAAPPPPVESVAPPPAPEDVAADDFAPPASTWTEPVFEDPAVPAAAPPAPEPEASEPEASAPAEPGVEAPTWDPQRNTYIQWDPALNAWMEWSASAQGWIPISQ
ncbi:MAG: RDD family protein [Acidobacteria bacterium]|nr:RDD family protein [Acidobacteriota bacterium]